jgi:uncharacterized protein (TIGR00369 family)
MLRVEDIVTAVDLETHYRALEKMYLGARTNEYYQPSIKVSRGFCEVTVLVRPDFYHSANSVHGSVYFKLLDDAAYFAAASLFLSHHLLTATFSLTFLRPVTQGSFRAEGTSTYRSSRIVVADAKAYDYKNRLVATGSGTFMPSQLQLDEKVGYHL